ESFPRDAGFATLLVAVSKVVFYDTTHLAGPLRIAALVGGGAVLLLGAMLANRRGEARVEALS
ncbi:MAG: hypothetical protein JNG84_08465, partial [Archangium sp.]|nr:hypothetical protein [Archangium sp.]